MGSVFNRGKSRTKPNWYVKFKNLDGEWKMLPSGQPTKAAAKGWLSVIEARVKNGLVGLPERRDEPKCGPLMQEWAVGLTNRNRNDDRNRLRLHLLPVFADRRVSDVTIKSIMEWLDRQRADGKLSASSVRHNLNLLSRFFSWAIERGHASINPVRQIPVGRRPQQATKRDIPWLEDDGMVRLLMSELPSPFDLMFFLGNRSGLRTGEIAGLRMADLGFLDDGAIRVRFSYEGPLKEDKSGLGKIKWAPATDDAKATLAGWLAARRASGAGPEDLVFPCPSRGGRCYRKELIESRWDQVRVRVKLTWYEATRHSFVSRNLSLGASLDEVSSAVGHSSPVVTRRYYDHFVRKSFSSTLTSSLKGGGEILRLPSATKGNE